MYDELVYVDNYGRLRWNNRGRTGEEICIEENSGGNFDDYSVIETQNQVDAKAVSYKAIVDSDNTETQDRDEYFDAKYLGGISTEDHEQCMDEIQDRMHNHQLDNSTTNMMRYNAIETSHERNGSYQMERNRCICDETVTEAVQNLRYPEFPENMQTDDMWCVAPVGGDTINIAGYKNKKETRITSDVRQRIGASPVYMVQTDITPQVKPTFIDEVDVFTSSNTNEDSMTERMESKSDVQSKVIVNSNLKSIGSEAHSRDIWKRLSSESETEIITRGSGDIVDAAANGINLCKAAEKQKDILPKLKPLRLSIKRLQDAPKKSKEKSKRNAENSNKTSITQSLDDIISIAVKLAKDLKADSQKQKEILTIRHGRTKEEENSESTDDQVKQTKKQNELKVNMGEGNDFKPAKTERNTNAQVVQKQAKQLSLKKKESKTTKCENANKKICRKKIMENRRLKKEQDKTTLNLNDKKDGQIAVAQNKYRRKKNLIAARAEKNDGQNKRQEKICPKSKDCEIQECGQKKRQKRKYTTKKPTNALNQVQSVLNQEEIIGQLIQPVFNQDSYLNQPFASKPIQPVLNHGFGCKQNERKQKNEKKREEPKKAEEACESKGERSNTRQRYKNTFEVCKTTGGRHENTRIRHRNKGGRQKKVDEGCQNTVERLENVCERHQSTDERHRNTDERHQNTDKTHHNKEVRWENTDTKHQNTVKRHQNTLGRHKNPDKRQLNTEERHLNTGAIQENQEERHQNTEARHQNIEEIQENQEERHLNTGEGQDNTTEKHHNTRRQDNTKETPSEMHCSDVNHMLDMNNHEMPHILINNIGGDEKQNDSQVNLTELSIELAHVMGRVKKDLHKRRWRQKDDSRDLVHDNISHHDIVNEYASSKQIIEKKKLLNNNEHDLADEHSDEFPVKRRFSSTGNSCHVNRGSHENSSSNDIDRPTLEPPEGKQNCQRRKRKI